MSKRLKVDSSIAPAIQTPTFDFETLGLIPMCIGDMDWLIEKSDLACIECRHHLTNTQHGQTHCIISVQSRDHTGEDR